ncbi:IclR family transcriptional regulator [Actinoplanes sp. N902-109]|uniref:IclR family transcriptional regulator n=1 Tax=Actinoplanes sp. (strain N902-109) TaxID=649831 RepID=UPI000329681C|nr:IclR family transcriptional regulator [Actinoplanes sp. N902-109]AGL17213.1 transcriptional regulator, IclR family [Actinoplanes sp. N902-109]
MTASDDDPQRPREVRSVSRALDILSAFSAAHPRLQLSELADAVGLPRPSVRRLALTLIERGFLRQDDDGAYLLGNRLLELGSQVVQTSAIVRRTSACADDLSRMTGETVLVAEVDWASLSLLIVGKRQPVNPAAATSPVGRRVAIASGCMAKAVLFGLPPEGAAAIVPRLRLTARTPRSIVDPGVLAADIEASRARGYAIQSNEFLPGMAGVAVPIHVDGKVAGTVAVLGMAVRYPRPQLDRTGQLIRRVLAHHRLG